MTKIPYRLYKSLILFIVFSILSISIVFLMFSLSETTHSLNTLKQDFNADFVIINMPRMETIEYVIDHFNSDYTLYSLETYDIDEVKIPLYTVTTNSEFDILMYPNRIFRYRNPVQEIQLNTVYQNKYIHPSILTNPLKTNYLSLEKHEINNFLYAQKSIDQISKENIYMIKIAQDTQTYRDFVSINGLPNNNTSIDYQMEFYVTGNRLYKAMISQIEVLMQFLFVIYLIPVLLFIMLFSQTYKIMLSKSLIEFKVRHIFYQPKLGIVLNEFGQTVFFFLISYIMIILIFSLMLPLHIETIQYLIITMGVIVLAILYTTLKVVSHAITDSLSFEGDII